MKRSDDVAERIIEGVAIGFVTVAFCGTSFYVGWMIGSFLHSVVSW